MRQLAIIMLLSLVSLSARAGCPKVAEAHDAFTGATSKSMTTIAGIMMSTADGWRLTSSGKVAGAMHTVVAKGHPMQILLADGTVIATETVDDAVPVTNVDDYGEVYSTYTYRYRFEEDYIRQMAAQPVKAFRFVPIESSTSGDWQTSEPGPAAQKRLQKHMQCVVDSML